MSEKKAEYFSRYLEDLAREDRELQRLMQEYEQLFDRLVPGRRDIEKYVEERDLLQRNIRNIRESLARLERRIETGTAEYIGGVREGMRDFIAEATTQLLTMDGAIKHLGERIQEARPELRESLGQIQKCIERMEELENRDGDGRAMLDRLPPHMKH